MLRLAQKAAKQLRGLRLVPPGAEDGRITHLVVAQERRTLKVLLAIAAGAFLLQPEWLAASLQAGAWLPEEPFWAKVLQRLAPLLPVLRYRLLASLPEVPWVLSQFAAGLCSWQLNDIIVCCPNQGTAQFASLVDCLVLLLTLCNSCTLVHWLRKRQCW